MRSWILLPFLATPALAEVDLPSLINELRDTEVVILGEIHGNPAHHENQELIIRAIFPSALVFEMFTPEQAQTINTMRWDGATLDSLEAEFEWDKSGWPSFEFYRALLEADAEGVVYGGATPLSQIAEAAFDGAFAIYGPDGIDYGLDQPLSKEEISKREADYILTNCAALDDGDLAGLIEGERLRAAVMADTVLLALSEAAYPVVVITGNDLANEDYGIPAMLRKIYPDILVTTIGQFEFEPVGDAAYTHVLVTGEVEKEDPCLDFTE